MIDILIARLKFENLENENHIILDFEKFRKFSKITESQNS